MRIQRVLCAIDYSDYSSRTLRHAAAIATSYDANLHVLHVVPDLLPTYVAFAGPLPPLPITDVEPAARQALEAFVDGAGVELPASRVVRRGKAFLEIAAYAEEIGADLIVVGTHGYSGFDHVMLGSTAERLLHHAPCPVLTVPRGADEAGFLDRVRFSHVLCAVDFSPASIEALAQGLSIAQEHGAQLTLLHVLETLADEDARTQAHYRVGEFVTERRREMIQRLEDLVPESARTWCRVSSVVALGKPGRIILREADARQADLIVMGAQGRGDLGLMLFGSATQTVVREATCPVLTARAAQARRDARPALQRARATAG
jgi:nucleotide-binding universal stress UspA family protein